MIMFPFVLDRNGFFQLKPESRNCVRARGKDVAWERPDGQVGIERRLSFPSWVGKILY